MLALVAAIGLGGTGSTDHRPPAPRIIPECKCSHADSVVSCAPSPRPDRQAEPSCWGEALRGTYFTEYSKPFFSYAPDELKAAKAACLASVGCTAVTLDPASGWTGRAGASGATRWATSYQRTPCPEPSAPTCQPRDKQSKLGPADQAGDETGGCPLGRQCVRLGWSGGGEPAAPGQDRANRAHGPPSGS